MKQKNRELYFIRLRDAPVYLGMDKNRFNSEVRPSLQEVPIGDRGIAFDRHDLDAWAMHYKALHARPAQHALCNKNTCSVCSDTLPLASTKKISDTEFNKKLMQALSKKNNGTR